MSDDKTIDVDTSASSIGWWHYQLTKTRPNKFTCNHVGDMLLALLAERTELERALRSLRGQARSLGRDASRGAGGMAAYLPRLHKTLKRVDALLRQNPSP